jgi:hypothetical protein
MVPAVVVARTKMDGLEYLAEGSNWTETAERAARFLNVREATRVALRLPNRFKAFALPLYHAA